ncbi:hypothetical protein [Alteromonas mediterranea]|uniref:hypothetical protein n=1 Tax=Alteromonas mediterranea TaxID=314275 RepID=UPI0012FA2D2C|nr:hypothetical protein [Alteromonas mediterranea]QGX62682.1 hypothetical protein FJN15_13270 [Alteromonas mediterranea]
MSDISSLFIQTTAVLSSIALVLLTLIKAFLPKVLEVWFLKRRELRDHFTKERFSRELSVYQELWKTVSSENISVLDEEVATKAQNVLCNLRIFLHANRPFIHSSLLSNIDSILDYCEKITSRENTEDIGKAVKAIDALATSIRNRIYKNEL